MCQSPPESATIAITGVQRKMNKIVSKHQRELNEARQQIGLFLKANEFPNGGGLRCRWILQRKPVLNKAETHHLPLWFFLWGDTNGKKGVIFVTFPLHEAVKQNDAYMTSKLLLFGADPTLKDT